MPTLTSLRLGYFGKKENLDIAEKMKVAFSECSNLTSVVIPDSVTSIGASAFQGCSNLTAVVIPDSVTSIEWYAFDSCSSLATITIKSTSLSVGSNAFSSVASTGTIYIPDSKINDDTYKALFTNKGLPGTWTFAELSKKPE